MHRHHLTCGASTAPAGAKHLVPPVEKSRLSPHYDVDRFSEASCRAASASKELSMLTPILCSTYAYVPPAIASIPSAKPQLRLAVYGLIPGVDVRMVVRGL